mgnify:CR=1 FL=1
MDQHHEIGETAGKIYRVLEQGGDFTLSALQKNAKVTDTALFNQAVGWLAREAKLSIGKSGRSVKVCLLGVPV